MFSQKLEKIRKGEGRKVGGRRGKKGERKEGHILKPYLQIMLNVSAKTKN